MPSLIAPELMAQMIQARSMPMAMGGGGALAAPDQMGMFQRAHAMRAGNAGLGQMTPQTGPQGGRGPLAQSLSGMKVKAMMLDAMDVDDEHRSKFKDALSDNGVTPQAFEQALRLHHETRQAKQQPMPQQPAPNTALPQTGPYAGKELKPGGMTMFTHTYDAGPVDMQAHQGSTPAPPPVAAPQAKAPNPNEAAREQHTQFTENKTVLDELAKRRKAMLDAHPELGGGAAQDPNVTKDWTAINQEMSDVQGRMNGLVTPQQQATPQQGQAPAPPKPGDPITPQVVQQFIQMAGGDKAKAKAMAQQAGWGF